MVNFGVLAAELSPVVCGTPANFNEFRVLPSLLQGGRSPQANETFHDVRPSPVLALAPKGILPAAKFTLRPRFALSYIGSVTARHSSSGVSQTLRR